MDQIHEGESRNCRAGKQSGRRTECRIRKAERVAQPSELQRNLNPIITIDESKGEALFMVVDFSLPKWNHVRRIISKRLANRNITAVIYAGTPVRTER